MPKTAKKNVLLTRLSDEDMERFREIAAGRKVSHTELLREAARYYMASYDQAKMDDLEGVYAQQLRGSTNRICGLMAKTAIEVHAILEVMRRMDGGDELVKDAMSVASKRLSKGLEKEEQKVREQMARVVKPEDGQ